ncbi:putative ATPase/DNA-binding CsgD family transcriptional regulator [Spinactinospora alkalitolerans]|uniref:Putative ATPase/DNA-binding CsgD family transcriptional regulator n=1 Tax=Spinactinospora alkalitolerans TaxID=687207 RepID=A0A852TQ36_9ACTN|nr:LuxR C-terminal-related transcriptional regulator [Spinactinospora alkalitolerans]NYE46099.1 putative ATPase/DNA-binding CsgD family transcriptional regulator [Spinactinospora alkalitolerans]
MSHPRHHLPAYTGPFIGRERDVTDLCVLLGDARMVTLTGTGGIGKTRVAVRVAERCLPRFPDGVVLADLSGAATEEQAMRAVARALGAAGDGGNGAEAPSRTSVAALLRPQRILLLLDTCERAVAPLAGLCRTVLSTCPEVRILATSREPLRIPGETTWRLPPLSLPARRTGPWRAPARPPRSPVPEEIWPVPVEEALRHDAVRLFVTRATAARPGFEATPHNIGHIIEVCRELDGVPLAIELAAARIRVLSVEQILERLDDRFPLLARTDRDLPPRQRTMRAAVEWSHRLLTEPEQVLLRRLSMLSGWPLDMAEDLFAFPPIPRDDVLDLHESLLDKSLIVLDSESDGAAWYRLPTAVRAYAAEMLAANGEEEVYHRRFLDYAVSGMERAAALVSGPMLWARRRMVAERIDRGREDLNRLLVWALEHGEVAEGLRLCTAMRTYWIMRDLFAESSALLRDLLAAAPPDLPDPVRARALVVYAELCLDVDGPAAAEAAAAQGLRLAREHGDEAAEAAALAALAGTALRTEGVAAGWRDGQAALEASRRSGDRATEMLTLGTLGMLANQRGDHAAAERFLNESLTVAEDLGDAWSAARCRNGLGMLSTRRGDLSSAADHLNAALAVFEETRSGPDSARCLAGLGRLAIVRGDVAEARRRLTEGLRLSVVSGRGLAIARALETLAGLAMAEEQPTRAATLGAAAEAIHADLGRHGRYSARLRSHAGRRLGAEAAAAAWSRGRTLSLKEVVEEALSFPEPPSSPSPLTPRENEIAGLVGAGLSNREIAGRLFISQATAARHIANIFAKLGFSSRAQLADWTGHHDVDP